MIGGALAQALASLAVAILQWYWQRQDIRDTERAKIALAGLEQINKALDWKASHPVVADPGDPFADFVHEPKPDAKPADSNPPKAGTP